MSNMQRQGIREVSTLIMALLRYKNVWKTCWGRDWLDYYFDWWNVRWIRQNKSLLKFERLIEDY